MSRSSGVLLIAPFAMKGLQGDRYFSNRNISDYHAIFFDLSVIESELLQAGLLTPSRQVSDTQIGHIQAILRDYNARLLTYVLEGGIVVLSCRDLPELQTPTHTLRVADETLLSLAEPDGAHGDLIEWCGPVGLRDLVKEAIVLTDKLGYEVLLRGNIQPLYRTLRKEEAVGGFIDYGEGLILFAPILKPSGTSDLRPLWVGSMLALAKALDERSDPSLLPDWSRVYRLPQEKLSYDTLAALEADLARTQAAIRMEQQSIAEEETWKALFAANGDAFSDIVAEALRVLGFTVETGPKARADLVASHNGRLVAIEAKGVTGSARERDGREAVSWVQELAVAYTTPPGERDSVQKQYAAVIAKLGIPEYQEGVAYEEPKGLLIIGTFAALPPVERGGRDFPDTMLRRMKESRLCAATGLQLLGMVLTVRANPESATELSSRLMVTDGVLSGYEDWPAFLTLDRGA